MLCWSQEAVGIEKALLVAHWDWVLYNFRIPLAKALQETGYEVVMVCPKGRYNDAIREEGFRVVTWNVSRESINPLSEIVAIRRLVRIYRSESPVTVQHFTIKPNLYGSIAAAVTGVPRVINTFTGLGYVFSSEVVPLALRTITRPLMKWAFHGPNVHIVFQNADDRDRFVQLGIARDARTTVIRGSGVDVERFSPRASAPSRDDRVVVVMAARLLKEKGVEDLVVAARSVRGDNLDVRFIVAGSPDPGSRSSIEPAQLDRWAEEGSVEFVGHRSDMSDLLRASDIAVLPTFYPEGLPRFLLEAAATGLPLIATDISACRQIVHDGVNGYLVPPRDPLVLADRVRRLVLDPQLRGRFGAASRKIAIEDFDERKVLIDYVDVYRTGSTA